MEDIKTFSVTKKILYCVMFMSLKLKSIIVLTLFLILTSLAQNKPPTILLTTDESYKDKSLLKI